MSGLSINRYQPIIGQLLSADYRPESAIALSVHL